MENEELSQ